MIKRYSLGYLQDEKLFKRVHTDKSLFLETSLYEEMINKVSDITNNMQGYSHSYAKCPMVEDFNRMILNPKSEYYRRGVVIVREGISLGYLKFKGGRTFLSWRNVYSDGVYPLVFGGIYGVKSRIVRKSKDIVEPRRWGILNVDMFCVEPFRFINWREKEENYLLLDRLREQRDEFDRLLLLK